MIQVEYENLKGVNQDFFADYQQQIQSVIESGWYILGKQVAAFEEQFAQYHGMKHAIGVASGLDALILALMALDLPPKSEVIVAANAYVACILSILRAGHVPVLVEPDPNTSNIDVNKIAEKITAKTKVIMPVHMYGYPCDMHKITELSQKHQLHVIEDCAQAHGAHVFRQKVGTFSSISAFSFYPTKNLGALGDAGAMLTNDDQYATKLRALRNYGSHIKYHNDYIGLNSRLDEVQAAFLLTKLPFLERINDHKRRLATLYQTHLDKRYHMPKHEVGLHGVYHIYNVYHDKRDALRTYLKDHGVGTEIHYPIPPYRQTALAGLFDLNAFPMSDKMHATTLSLPISYCHRDEDIRYVCEVMNQFIERNSP